MNKFVTFAAIAWIAPSFSLAGNVAITMDNPNTYEGSRFSPRERDQEIRKTLKDAKLKISLFASGHEIENPEGQALLKNWDRDGHIIANHTYSHKNYNSEAWTFEKYSTDILKNEPLVSSFKNSKKYFRFVMLKEGDTAKKRDDLREFFKKHGYRNIPVTIDASDWYIDSRLQKKLQKNPKADLKPYRNYYLAHIWDRTQYYDNLAKKVLGREIPHTLLIHHNLLNALFLKDVLELYRKKNWKVVELDAVLKDDIFSVQTKTLPAGESVVWSLAKESGKFEAELRYPGEDSIYEEAAMDKLGL